MAAVPERHAYLRVSTPDQNTDRQAHGLREVCDMLHIEYVSAVAKARPVFDTVIAHLRRGDTFVVWDLDRAFRSTVDAILTAEALRARGVHFRIISLQVDTTTPEGELFYTILAGFAQYERRIIARRTVEGMEAARRKGKVIGRPRSLKSQVVRDAYDWITETDYPHRYVAALLGVSRVTLQRAFKRQGLLPQRKP
ncbi:recombinase family protein [Nisaea nitritireducens]|uniref:recombinase family protein n=1 Tax=Nisaea nitritireducens TaxID=568392 RepID=UPI0018689D57|nr:recombinase family protein [Nisaea nitritireducens]